MQLKLTKEGNETLNIVNVNILCRHINKTVYSFSFLKIAQIIPTTKELIMYKTLTSFLIYLTLKITNELQLLGLRWLGKVKGGEKLFPHSSTFIIMLSTFICIYLLKYTFYVLSTQIISTQSFSLNLSMIAYF